MGDSCLKGLLSILCHSKSTKGGNNKHPIVSRIEHSLDQDLSFWLNFFSASHETRVIFQRNQTQMGDHLEQSEHERQRKQQTGTQHQWLCYDHPQDRWKISHSMQEADMLERILRFENNEYLRKPPDLRNHLGLAVVATHTHTRPYCNFFVKDIIGEPFTRTLKDDSGYSDPALFPSISLLDY